MQVHQLFFGGIETVIPAGSRGKSITASTPTGWTFLCWINAIPKDWPGGVSVGNPDSETGAVWIDDPNPPTVDRSVFTYYLAYR